MPNAIARYPVPLIFKKAFKDNMSGELTVMHKYFTKKLFLVDSRLAFAATTQESERLGQLLLSAGKISMEQLEKALQIQRNNTKKYKIGEILVKTTPLEMRDIYHALKEQVIAISSSLFSLADGEWRFSLKKPDLPDTRGFKIKIPDVVRAGLKRVEDFSYYKKRFMYRAPATRPIPRSMVGLLESDEFKFYMDLTACTDMRMEQVMEKMPLAERVFWRNTATLYLLNIADFVEYTADEERNKNIEELNDLYEKVKNGGANYYDLLGLDKNASKDQIDDKYNDCSRKFHPDRVNAAPDSTSIMKANAVLAEINHAYSVLHDENRKRDYDAQSVTLGNRTGLESSRADNHKQARNLYLKANTCYKTKRYYEAVTMLEDALSKDNSKANYYLLLGLAQSKIPAYKKAAEENLTAASNKEPWNADPLFALGELYKSEGLIKKAEIYFKKALEINMEHTLAGKAMKDLGGLYGSQKKTFSLFGKKK